MEKDIDAYFACLGRDVASVLLQTIRQNCAKNSVLLWLRAFPQTSAKTSILKKGGYVFPDTVIGDNSGIGVIAKSAAV